MTISLRKIAQHAALYRVELLGEQTHVIAAREQTLEQFSSFSITPLQDVIVDKPEAARQERALPLRKAIPRIVAFIAQHEFVIDQQFPFDRPKRSLDARVRRGKEANQRDEQETRVEAFGPICLDKTVEFTIKAAFTDFGMDFVGDLAPALARLIVRFRLDHICSAIERDPSHDL